MKLLNPGPVCLTPRVRDAMLGPDLCHRSEAFTALQSRIRTGLLATYDLDPAEWTAVLLTGSGTTAVEATLASLLPPDTGLLVVENGVYGERMTAMARAHGVPVATLALPWGAIVEPGQLAATLDATTDVTDVAVVHHETTTGRLNDLAALGFVCRERGLRLHVDAVSSFGAEAIPFAAGAVTSLAGTANKCLHGVPGVAFVIARRSHVANCPPAARSVVLDLVSAGAEQDRGGTAFTQSPPCLYALDAALAEHRDAGGWRGRRSRYRQLGDIVARGLQAVGITRWLASGPRSCVLTAYRLPPGVEIDPFQRALAERGFLIYPGQAGLRAGLFRVATMGALSDDDLERFTEAVADVTPTLGARLVTG